MSFTAIPWLHPFLCYNSRWYLKQYATLFFDVFDSLIAPSIEKEDRSNLTLYRCDNFAEN